jgi:HK97 family phage major capsid protein
MATPVEVLKQVVDVTKKNAQGIASLSKAIDEQRTALATQRKEIDDFKRKSIAPGHPNPADAFGAPNMRVGENVMGSRGYSFAKMIGLITGACNPEDAKIELDVHNRLHACMHKNLGTAGYRYGGTGIEGVRGGRFLAPRSTEFMHDEYVEPKFRHEMKSLMAAGVYGADLDHMRHIRVKQLQQSPQYGHKTLSWLNDYVGGALVPPPEFGELIELLRNKEALINAGARTVPLPPQGRMTYPRQTSPSSAYWVGENAPITATDIGTGTVTLQAKKLAVRIVTPNELIRFASPAAEALLRDDMTKSLALALDLAGLEGLGGDTRPRGIINTDNINTLSSSAAGANGDRVVAGDIYRMLALLEEVNVEGTGFIMRPKSLYKYYQLRTDAVSQGDAQGPFLFNLIREPGEGIKPMLAGKPVTTSNQVSMVRSKGSASNLTYILYGKWDELLIGMFGAIEFAATTVGDTSFTNDQTWIRAILSADVAVRYPAAFLLMDQLDVTL